MFFESWEAIARVLITGTLSYIALIILLRASGKRTLSKMNMFDFIITVALGSAFATIVLSPDIMLAEGVAALALLIYLQYAVAWLSVRSKRFRGLVKGEPTLLFYQGSYLRYAMWRERITEEEIRASVRNNAVADMRNVRAVVLETDGSLTVVPASEYADASMLDDVQRPPGGG